MKLFKGKYFKPKKQRVSIWFEQRKLSGAENAARYGNGTSLEGTIYKDQKGNRKIEIK